MPSGGGRGGHSVQREVFGVGGVSNALLPPPPPARREAWGSTAASFTLGEVKRQWDV